MMMELTDPRVCTKCRETKQVRDFHRDSGARDGLRGHCRDCINAAIRERKKRDPEKERARARARYAANPRKHLDKSMEVRLRKLAGDTSRRNATRQDKLPEPPTQETRERRRKKNRDYKAEYQAAKLFCREYREKFPLVYAAHNKVEYRLRKGALVRECCEVCGETKTEAHHDDYLQPLRVRWLCVAHHAEWHRVHGPGLNHDLLPTDAQPKESAA